MLPKKEFGGEGQAYFDLKTVFINSTIHVVYNKSIYTCIYCIFKGQR